MKLFAITLATPGSENYPIAFIIEIPISWTCFDVYLLKSPCSDLPKNEISIVIEFLTPN